MIADGIDRPESVHRGAVGALEDGGPEGDRGDGPIGLLIGASVFVLGSTMMVNAALGHHAYPVMAGSAQEGAVTAARLDGTVTDGTAVTDRLIARSAGSLVSRSEIEARLRHDDDGRSAVVITVAAEVIGPLGRRTVEASGAAPVEEFVAQRPVDGPR